MITTENWFLAIVEAMLWYGFIYYLLYSIKNPVNLAQSALILLIIAYVATLACPWFRNTDAWKRMLGKNRGHLEGGLDCIRSTNANIADMLTI